MTKGKGLPAKADLERGTETEVEIEENFRRFC